jgi:Flp pilus assembly protein TadB
MTKAAWTGPELDSALRRFERELRDAGIEEPAVRTYVTRSESFVRWLEGDWRPGAGVRPAARAHEASAGRSAGRRLLRILGYAAIFVFGIMWLALPFLVLVLLIVLA